MKITPSLDPDFFPAILWNQKFEQDAEGSALSVTLGLCRDNTVLARRKLKILPDSERSLRYVERTLKTLIWSVGGNRILFAGPDDLFDRLQKHYSDSKIGQFDSETIGVRLFDLALKIEQVDASMISDPTHETTALGRHLDGCRIGFDLGGSERKCAALVDGEVIFSEQIKWNPYFEKNPQYHYDAIMDSLQRAATHLPHVDAIGGSAAGVYVNNEVRVSSLFRGVENDKFDTEVRPIFKKLKQAWNGIPFEVANDGEVTALAGAMSLKDDAVLGISMGTSLAAGYVTPEGTITSWLNELAFVPVDYRIDGPVDEWSGDAGCGVQFFSQQGVARLAPLAGIDFKTGTPYGEQLAEVRRLMSENDPRARKIYETIGTCFGYTIAQYSTIYDFRNLLVLGGVTAGEGGQIIIQNAELVLQVEFPDLASTINISMPEEQMKRHGQAVAAASLAIIK
ncbi:MAG: ROK family protein [Akkermansiaceae bacterium]